MSEVGPNLTNFISATAVNLDLDTNGFYADLRMRRVLIALTLLVLDFSAIGQIQLADSLRSKLLGWKSSVRPDTVYLSILNSYIYSLQYLNPDSALILGELAGKRCKEIGFQSGYIEAVRNVGIVYYLKGNFIKSLEYFLEALKVAEQAKDKRGIARIYNNIGLIYYGQNKYEEALESQKKSLAIKEEIKDKPGIAISLNNIANIYKNLNNYSESLRYHKLSLAAKQELGDERSIAASLNNIGWLYLKQRDYDEAYSYLIKAQPMATVSQDKILICDIHQGLAECLLSFKEYESAIENAVQSLRIAESISLKDQLRDCNETLSRIYKEQKMFDKALFHYELFKIYSDSINNKEVAKKTASLEAQYDFEKKEALLTAQQAKLNASHDKNTLQLRWIIFSILGGLLFVLVIAALIYRNRNNIELAYKKLEEANIEINNKSEALRNINVVLMKQKAEVIEQRDLVTLQNKKLQEISATLGQHKQNLELEVEKRTQELEAYARQMEQFAFFTAHDLRAPVATILGLANLLSHYANSPDDKHLIFEMLITTTRKLDNVVKQLNKTIDERKSVRVDIEMT